MNDNKTIWPAVAIFGLIVVCILGALIPAIKGDISTGNWIAIILSAVSLIANGVFLFRIIDLKKSRQQPARNTSERPLSSLENYMEYASGVRHGNVPIRSVDSIGDLVLSDSLAGDLTPEQRVFWREYWNNQRISRRPVPLDDIGRASGVAEAAAEVLTSMGPARAVPSRQVQFRNGGQILDVGDTHLGSVRGHSGDIFRYRQAAYNYVQVVELGRIGRLEEEVEQGGTLYYVISMDGKTGLYKASECRKLQEGDIL